MAQGELPGRERADIQAEIERAREDIASSLLNLQREVKGRLEWRSWVRKKPAAAVAAAFAIGYLIGRR